MKKIAYLCYGVFFIAFAIQLWYAMSEALTFTTVGKIAIVFLQVAMLILGTVANIKTLSKEQKRSDIRFAQILLFLLFIGNLSYLLFFDRDFGRANQTLNYSLSEYFQLNVNLIPFNTIKLYIHAYQENTLSLNAIVLNLLGNIVAFMPFAYFLPALFRSQRKWYVFFITMLFSITSVEVIQVLTQSGCGDVDDLILNLSGVFCLYLIFKLPLINKMVYKNDNR